MSTAIHEVDPGRRMRSRRPPKRAILALLFGLLSPVGLHAANLLSNSEFPSSVLPWVHGTGALYWSNLDHAGNTSSGSARISDNDGAFFVGSMASECMKIQGGSAANVTVYLQAAGSVPSNSKINIKRFYYTTYTSATSCSGTITDATGNLLNIVPPSNWTKVTHSHTAPSTARAVRLQIESKSGVDASTFDILADGIVLDSSGSTSTTPFFADGFEDGSTRSWSSTTTH